MCPVVVLVIIIMLCFSKSLQKLIVYTADYFIWVSSCRPYEFPPTPTEEKEKKASRVRRFYWIISLQLYTPPPRP